MQIKLLILLDAYKVYQQSFHLYINIYYTVMNSKTAIIDSIIQQPQQIPKPTKQTPSERKLRSIKSQTCFSNIYHQQNRQKGQINLKFAELRLLTKQKDELMCELNRLKQGAFSALLQKQQVIDKLKHTTNQYEYFQDEKQQMQKEMNKLMRKNKELIEQTNENNKKIESQRAFFFEDLFNKEVMIEELNQKLEKTQRENENLTQENQRLGELIAESQDVIRNQHKYIEELKEQIMKSKNKLQEILSLNLNQNTITQYINIQKSDEDRQNEFRTHIQHLQQSHNQEIEELTNFYENQLNIMRSICQKQYNQNGLLKKTLQTQPFTDRSENQSVYELMSLKSGPQFFHTLNLKNQLKDLKESQKNDENISHFTKKYFNLENKPKLMEKDSQEDYHTHINIIEQFQINQQQPHALIGMKQVVIGVGSGMFGLVLGAALMKALNK